MALERETLGFWERLMKFKDKYGYWNLTKLVLFVAFAVATLFLAKNFGESYSFERQKEAISEVMQENSQQMFIEHEEKMEQRRTIKPYVIDILKTTINEMGCGRAFVIELHNGSNNTAGLPFIHASMTYEVVARGIEPIDEDYQNISLTRFVFSEYLHEHDLWFGPIDEFIEMDPKMGGRLKHNGATYLVITTIRSEKNEIGYFGFIYYKKNELNFANKENMEFILNSVQKLSKLLDKDSKTI
jgi:hypothetical protein